MALTREQFLAKQKQRVKEIGPIPVWGDTAYIRTISIAEKDAWEASLMHSGTADKRANLQNVRARFAVMVLSDEKGNRIFHDNDALALGQYEAAPFEFIFDEGREFNGLTKKDVEEVAATATPAVTPPAEPAA
jgi:hypothetical protein